LRAKGEHHEAHEGHEDSADLASRLRRRGDL